VTIRGAGYDGAGSSSFVPGALSVTVGTSVNWTNTDTILHQTVSDTGVWRADIGPNGQFDFTFQTAGAFPYKCPIHGMTGTITVRP
jgi:plastocyanin